MSAVLLGIFNEYRVAELVRTELVRDGFPTDRVELTAGREPGRAGLEPADSPHGRLVQYFRVLFTFEDERHYAEDLAERVDNGDAIITVHPRGSMETRRATQILANAGAVQLISHDLAKQSPPWTVSKLIRRWILGALALCLLFAGYVVAGPEFRKVDLGQTLSELQLKQAQETEPDEINLPHTGYLPRRDLSAVIAHYFDTYLPRESLHLDDQSNHYTAVDNGNSSWWRLRNGVAYNASCFGAVLCGSHDTGQSWVLVTLDLDVSPNRGDVTANVFPLALGASEQMRDSVHEDPMPLVARDLDSGLFFPDWFL